MSAHLSDVQKLRDNARAHIERGPLIIRWLADTDITTRRLMESILAVEEEHADDLLTFLKQFGVSL